MPRLTKSFIDGLPLPARAPSGQARQTLYRDDALVGFGVLVGSGGTKSFFVERRINGRVKRLSLGRYGHLTPAQARQKAQAMLGTIAMGKDPVAEKRAASARGTTLGEAFEDYLQTRRDLKPGTVANYRKCIDGCLGDWKRRRLIDIDKAQVEQRHRDLSKRAPARANNAMRVLRAVFNHALAKYEDQSGKPVLQFNPVDRLGQVRAWNRVERRRDRVKPHQMAAWYRATLQLNEETTRDYLHFLLFTGLRKAEASFLRWDDIDFDDATITVRDTKNREPLVLPMSSFLTDLLERRWQARTSEWVFPSPKKPGQPLREPRAAVARLAKLWGHPFTLHDLRRTFTTTVDGLDIPHYALKRLINHSDRNDVTAGYITSGVERLRGPMQQVTDFLLEHTCAETLALARDPDTEEASA